MIIWDFVEAVSLSKDLQVQPLLPSASNSYGKLSIVDNACPIVQRTYTANAVTAAQVETVLAGGKTRNACFTLVTSLGTEYTGRFISMQAAQTKGTGLFQLTMVLQDIDDELSGTTQVILDLGEDDYTADNSGGIVDDGGDPIPED